MFAPVCETNPNRVLIAMILSDRDLTKRLEAEEIVIDPLIDPELQIQPASIDLRLGHEFVVYKLPHVACIDTRDPKSTVGYTETTRIDDGDYFILHPGEFVLGTTLEWCKIPDDLVARVEGRSSIGRLAIVVHATAGFIDPGFEGRITLELSNLGRVAVKLYPGSRISQLVFHTMTSPAERPYGPDRGSKYFGQEGPVVSRIGKDTDREE
jgi:dCTP deaminase